MDLLWLRQVDHTQQTTLNWCIMKIGKYKINSSVVIASILTFITAVTDALTSGGVVNTLADIIIYFLNEPETFKPYLTDKIYQFLLTFLPIMTIILRNTNIKYRPPVEKITE